MIIYYESIPIKFSSFISKLWSRPYSLKAILGKKIPKEIENIKKLRTSHGQMRIGEITVDNLYGGMRGVKGLICETSVLDPQHGIRFRGLTLCECMRQLPKLEGGQQALPEGVFWLLITGDVPDVQQVRYVSQEWANRSKIPDQTYEVLNALKDIHPMGQLSAAVISMTSESKFRKAYDNQVFRETYWEFIYEDAMDLLGRLIVIAALIYRNISKREVKQMEYPDLAKDWSHNFAIMLGFESPQFYELLRMYLTIHADHEGGNVSAHVVHLVGSALSDPYLAYSAGMNGLAGPRHGLSNQEVVKWLTELLDNVGVEYTEKDLKDYVWKTISHGGLIPGYGHSILRNSDPRYIIERQFAKTYIPDDKMCKLVADLYKVVPPILQQLGKIKNPWPNVDAHSGVLLRHYGLVEVEYHTVMFAVARAMGVLAQLVWSRALLFPVERFKSFSTKDLMQELRVT